MLPSKSDEEEERRDPLSRVVLEMPLRVGLEKPLPMGTYEGTTDLDGHIENIDALLNYRGFQGAIKCRMFSKTLWKREMAWYKSLPDESITSWKGLSRLFSRYFTALCRHPKSEAFLEAIIKGKNESLREFIELVQSS